MDRCTRVTYFYWLKLYIFVPVIFFNLSTKIKTTCISNLIKYFNTLTNYIFTFKHDNRGNPIVTITNVLFYDLLRKRRLEVEFNGDIFMADMMPSIQLSLLCCDCWFMGTWSRMTKQNIQLMILTFLYVLFALFHKITHFLREQASVSALIRRWLTQCFKRCCGYWNELIMYTEFSVTLVEMRTILSEILLLCIDSIVVRYEN